MTIYMRKKCSSEPKDVSFIMVSSDDTWWLRKFMDELKKQGYARIGFWTYLFRISK